MSLALSIIEIHDRYPKWKKSETYWEIIFHSSWNFRNVLCHSGYLKANSKQLHLCEFQLEYIKMLTPPHTHIHILVVPVPNIYTIPLPLHIFIVHGWMMGWKKLKPTRDKTKNNHCLERKMYSH